MPLSVAEKQRRYRERIKQDPERYNEYLSKEKKRWEDRKKTGKIKLISDMTKREKRHETSWKNQQAKCRQRKKSIDDHLTPPQ